MVAQPEKQVAGWRDEAEIIGAVGSGYATAGRPAGGRGEAAILRQIPARNSLPIDADGTARTGDVERGCTGCLQGVNGPEPACERVIAANHWPAGIVLTDGAAQRVLPVTAGASPARNFIPVDGVALGLDGHR